MTKNNLKSKEGFTIIEVVLVLAIAGLIFLMVFIAFPGLQRSQRDTQRRNDLANLATRIIDYQTNNRNQVPTDQAGWAKFQEHYFNNENYVDPDGNDYYIKYEGHMDSSTEQDNFIEDNFQEELKENGHQIHVWDHAHCNGESIELDDSPRKVAFLYMLEAGNIYCGQN